MSQLTTSARDNFVTCIAFLVVTTTAVITRFGTRHSIGQRPSGPDWLCLLALLFFYGYCVVIINYIFNVSNFRAFDTDPGLGLEELRNLLLASFVLEIFLSFVITSVKISILWFYHSIFRINRITRHLIYGTGIACVIWFIIAIFALIVFQCRPIDAYWNQFMSPAACLDAKRLLLGYELTNLFIDVVILGIPVVVIRKLRLSCAKKIGALVAFLLGVLVCISSIVRLTTIFDARDPSRPVLFSASITWSTIQAGLAIICSCVPTFGPLLGSIAKPFSYLISRYAPHDRRVTTPIDIAGSSRRKFEGFSATGENGSWIELRPHGGRSSHTWNSGFHKSGEHILQPPPAMGIVVSRQIDVN